MGRIAAATEKPAEGDTPQRQSGRPQSEAAQQRPGIDINTDFVRVWEAKTRVLGETRLAAVHPNALRLALLKIGAVMMRNSCGICILLKSRV